MTNVLSNGVPVELVVNPNLNLALSLIIVLNKLFYLVGYVCSRLNNVPSHSSHMATGQTGRSLHNYCQVMSVK